MSEDQEPAENQFPELTPFEASLAALAPQAAGLDREELFFQAGHAAALRDLGERRLSWTRWGWPAGFSAMTAVAATLLAMLCLRAGSSTIPSVAGTTPEIAAAAATPFVLPNDESQQEDRPAGTATYSRLCDEILRHGINACLPETVPTAAAIVAAPPLPYDELLNQILQEK